MLGGVGEEKEGDGRETETPAGRRAHSEGGRHRGRNPEGPETEG